jgi:DNA polymerase-3 subunit delta
VTPDEALERARKGDFPPLLVVVGEERLLRDEVILALREGVLAGGIPEFNEDKFSAQDTSIDKVLSAARTLPMMSPKRFVLVRGLERWDQGDGESKSAAMDDLAQYAEDPSPSTCLVLSGSKLDGRRKLASLAKKKNLLVSCDPLDARALSAFIERKAKDRGNPMAPGVAPLIAELSGPELGHVADVVERLSLFVGPGKEIDEHAVSECVARVRMADTWALVDAVGRRVRQLLKYVLAVAQGARPDEAARRAGAFQPARARQLEEKGRGMAPKELERWLTVLAEADLALKGSKRPPLAVLEDAVMRLCRRTAA